MGVAAIALLVAAGLSAPAALAALPASYQVQRIDSPESQGEAPDRHGDRFGEGFVNAGDVDSDGKDDLLVGIDKRGVLTGKVLVFSGANGSLIRTINPPSSDFDPGSSPNDAKLGFGTYVGKIADIGSCPSFSGTPGEDCNASVPDIDAGDGVPDQLVTAVGADVATPPVQFEGNDMGMAYVIDGRTGAVLKRIAMPLNDRLEHAQNVSSNPAAAGPGFGRSIVSPSGRWPCAGSAGIGVCERPGEEVSAGVAAGDVNGDGEPDIVIGASEFSETSSTNFDCPSTCSQAGRAYVYSGAALTGLSPGTPLETPLYTIKNPFPQQDGAILPEAPESFGHSISPVGDLGNCEFDNPALALCTEDPDPGNQPTNQPDGKADFVVSAHRTEVFRTDNSRVADGGLAFLVDAGSGRIMKVLAQSCLEGVASQPCSPVIRSSPPPPTAAGVPEPQPASSLFSFSTYNQPAPGDLGGTNTLPDMYQGAINRTVQLSAQGRGYALNGDVEAPLGSLEISTLDDPTPAAGGNFGTASAGIGDVARAEVGLDSRKELLIGSYDEGGDAGLADVHVFSPLTGTALQTIPDPDQQAGSGFGRALAPMGDLNGDGLLDLAIGAGGHDAGGVADRGRIYLLRSVASPSPPQQPPASATPRRPSTPSRRSSPVAIAGRSLRLTASKRRLRRGRPLTLRGRLQAFANPAACQRRMRVRVERRSAGRRGYRSFKTVTTNDRGRFSLRTRPRRTATYRARVGATRRCRGATSNRAKVTVRRATR